MARNEPFAEFRRLAPENGSEGVCVGVCVCLGTV